MVASSSDSKSTSDILIVDDELMEAIYDLAPSAGETSLEPVVS
jgi:hypothetical protein